MTDIKVLDFCQKLDQLNISIYDSSGKIKTTLEVLRELSTKWATLDKEHKDIIMKEVGFDE